MKFYTLIVALLGSFLWSYGQEEPETEHNGPQRQIDFFSELHSPYGYLLPLEVKEKIKADISNLPSDRDQVARMASFNSWEHVGPNGGAVGSGNKYSGRVSDLHIDADGNLLVASASGGLWKYTFRQGNLPLTAAIADNVPEHNGGAVVSHPNDVNTILFGTGEPLVGSGSGLFKTTDGGVTWTKATMSPFSPDAFFKIVYDPTNPDIVHAATTGGYFKSTNGGLNWTRIVTGRVSGLVMHPVRTDTIMIAIWNGKIMRSVNGGLNFSVLANAPGNDLGYTVLDYCKANPEIVFANAAKSSDNSTLGIFRTSDFGDSWLQCAISNNDNMHGDQGWYDNTISICPTNCNIVLAGGVSLYRTANGNSFAPINNPHADQQSMAWKPDGSVMYLGSDGGVYYSTNQGTGFLGAINTLPTTQFYYFDKSALNNQVMGGTQDNGIFQLSTSNAWSVIQGGDGMGVSFDPNRTSTWYSIIGYYGTGISFRRQRTTNNGANYANIDNGIEQTCTQWYTQIRTDYNNPTGLYTFCGRKAYYSTNAGVLWNEINTSNFTGNVNQITVSKGKNPAVYIVLSGSNLPVKKFEMGTKTLSNAMNGLPLGFVVRKVTPHPTDSNVAFCLMNGIDGALTTRKIFKTTDRGANWTNITGNMPNYPLTDVIGHPTDPNLIYVCGEFGALKTVDGGQNWTVWTHGLPNSINFTEMDFADSLAINGKFWVYGATYGRGIWKREVTGDDITNVSPIERASGLRLYQNAPNPFSSLTTIDYELSKKATIKLAVYDLLGKEVMIIESLQRNPGRYSVQFDRSQLRAGTYFYTLHDGEAIITKRMVVN